MPPSPPSQVHVVMPAERQLGTYSQIVFDEERYTYHDLYEKRYFGKVEGDTIRWGAIDNYE